jgi:CHASE3 domain sensor protein
MGKPGAKSKLLFLIFIASVTAMVIAGGFAFKASERLTALYEKREKQFEVITTAAAEVSSYAKRAEGHIFLYMMLHNPVDKEKFPKRIKSLHENIAILKKISYSPKAKMIVDKIIANTGENLSFGNALIALHDRAMQQTGNFKVEDHGDLLLKLHQRFSQIRRLGVELTAHLVAEEDRQSSQAYENATDLRRMLLVFATLAACFTLYTGYAFIRMISRLDKEIAFRIQFEQELEAERDKLKAALSEIKTLSGLIPICSSCKKIRDDKGYWNQVETYIRDHSDAKFSHGLCPECAMRLYPEIYEKILS